VKAVCLSCGAPKWGALVVCSSCGHRPSDPEDEARHVLASEEHLDDEALAALARGVRSGRAPVFDSEVVARIAAEHAAVPAAPVWFALLVATGPVLVVLGVFGALCGLLGLLDSARSP
jgi:hypothetical protein